jgi:hypothetical protein
MRLLLTALALLIGLSVPAAVPAAAESHTFVLSDISDGYGIDRCLTTGARCGSLLADAYCRSHDFRQAASFRPLAAADITGTLLVAERARPAAGTLIAIECSR